jgi:ABC-type multidrug transport system fused ATPase/permease subunit
MSSDARHKSKSNAEFWRACRYLYPYRGMVVISIVCAIFVSAALAGGLGTLVPITRVFLNGDTVQTWAEREIAQNRIGVTFAEQTKELRIVRIKPESPAARAGLEAGDALSLQGAAQPYLQTLDALSDPSATEAIVRTSSNRTPAISLPPVPWYLAAGRGIAARFPPDAVKAIAAVLAIIFSLAIVSNILSFIQEYLSDKAAVLAVNDIRRKLYDHVLHVPLSHFNTRGTSDVTSRLTQDAQNLTEGFKTVLGQSIQEPVKAAMAFGIAVWASWKLTMFIVVFGPIMAVIIKKFGKKMRRASKKAMVSSANMLGQIEGSLLGIRVVKGASAERFERRKYMRIMGRLVSEQLRMSRIDAFTEPTMGTLNLFVVGAIVLVAAHMVLDLHTLENTRFILVMACLASIGDSLRRVSKVNNVLQKSNAAAGRIFEVIDLPMERSRREREDAETRRRGDAVKEKNRRSWGFGLFSASPRPRVPASSPALHPASPRPRVPASSSPLPRIKLPSMQREIVFENVTFAYPGSPSPAVVNVNLTVPKGKSVAVVGHNGSGKTTLLALLPRFYDPQGGRILIDGVDIRHATLRSLRGQVSIVTQDSVIFPGTIAENIAYGHPLVGGRGSAIPQHVRDEIVAAAKRAFADEFIMDKPQGYDTLLGELGGQLSGGQKQRLCIARAIFRRSPILVLDEATSQVDAQSEDLIQQAIESVMHERTTFVIAHRFSTIRSADEIIVMHRGTIVGQGTHDELLATCDTYQQLYERQLFTMPADSPKAAVAQ